MNNDNKNSRNVNSNTSSRGFAAMSDTKQRKIASKGGKAAHRSGNAHEWNSQEAKEAGRKGGSANSRTENSRADDYDQMFQDDIDD